MQYKVQARPLHSAVGLKWHWSSVEADTFAIRSSFLSTAGVYGSSLLCGVGGTTLIETPPSRSASSYRSSSSDQTETIKQTKFQKLFCHCHLNDRFSSSALEVTYTLQTHLDRQAHLNAGVNPLNDCSGSHCCISDDWHSGNHSNILPCRSYFSAKDWFYVSV